jgi:hypothetical protein
MMEKSDQVRDSRFRGQLPRLVGTASEGGLITGWRFTSLGMGHRRAGRALAAPPQTAPAIFHM